MIKDWLKRIYYRVKYKSKGVTIGPGVTLDMNNDLEGYNDLAVDCLVASCRLGLGSYISRNAIVKKTHIGRFSSIGTGVQTCLGRHPSKDFVSTSPAFFSVSNPISLSFVENNVFEEHIYTDSGRKYVVTIGHDVWVGNNALVMDGVTIGNGAIVAAGSVVNKDVPPYAIVGGIPAKLIRYRFTAHEIEFLERICWWDWDLKKIKAHGHLFNNIDVFRQSFSG